MAYRRIDPRMWDDEWFIRLSTCEAKLLWNFLLTGPTTSMLPGLFVGGIGSIIDGLRMDAETVSRAFSEIEATGRVQIDRTLRVIRIPNAPKHNKPENPNVVRGWWTMWRSIPDSPLKVQHIESLKLGLELAIKALPAKKKRGSEIGFRRAWDNTFGTLGQTVTQTSPNTGSGTGSGSGTGTNTTPQAAAHAPIVVAPGFVALTKMPTLDEAVAAGAVEIPRQAVTRAALDPDPKPPEAWPGWGRHVDHSETQEMLAQLGDEYRDAFDPDFVYNAITDGSQLAQALRNPPLSNTRDIDPVAALRLAFKGHASDPVRMGAGRLRNRRLFVLLRPDNLRGAIDMGQALNAGKNPHAIENPEPRKPAQPTPASHQRYRDEPEAGVDPSLGQAAVRGFLNKGKSEGHE